MSNPLQPSPSLLSKLGSALTHLAEWQSRGGHAFDRIALDSILADEEVREWLEQMDSMALIPKKR